MAIVRTATPKPTPGSDRRPSTSNIGTDEMVAALRTIPHGGIDDAARSLALSPQLRANISPILNSFRWAAVMYGMIFGTARVFEEGSYEVVISLTVCLFLTCWRTIIPLRLGSTQRKDQILGLTDTLILGLGAGYSGALESPYVFCVLAAILIVAFGWGYVLGLLGVLVGLAGLTFAATLSPDPIPQLSSQASLAILMTMVLVTTLAAFTQARLLESEERRVSLAGKVDTLTETNDLLTMLNTVARTLPTSLNKRDALEAARDQIVSTFRCNVICLLEFDEGENEWIPKLAEGCTLRPSAPLNELPANLRNAVQTRGPRLVRDLRATGEAPIAVASTSGLYIRLVARDQLIGVLGIETSSETPYEKKDLRLLAGLGDVLALTLDNARWFGRLRSLGAEEERIRIARDLHDRLGQWLTYIGFELERIISSEDSPNPELSQLYTDIQQALDELRETLRQLRSGISEERSLSLVGAEAAQRFQDRTSIPVSFSVGHDISTRLPIPVETEMLRILQESLNNIDKHANATSVDVRWTIDEDGGTLQITDNGAGFDASKGVRDNAYGLVGMRERADVIGGKLSIESSDGSGTTIKVSTSNQTTRERANP